MKKLMQILSAVFILSAMTSVAQTTDQTMKATSGITTDVNFSPFSSPITLDFLNARWFFSPGYALRLGLEANVSNSKWDNNQPDQDRLIEKRISSTFGLHPGIEKHFTGTNRLSPYIGAELSYVIHSQKAIFESETEELYRIEGSLSNSQNISERAYNSLGFGLLTGVDFYIARNLYMGVEFGYGMAYRMYGKVEQIEDGNTLVLAGERNQFHLGSNVRTSLKLGWKF